MAEWSTTAGDATTESSTSLQWQPPSGSRLIDSALVSGGGVAYLRDVRIERSATFGIVRIQTSPVDSGTGSGAGPELVAGFEGSSGGVSIAAGNLLLTVTGPNHADTEISDASEPYTWFYEDGSTYAAAIGSFITSFQALTQSEKDAAVVTLRDFNPVAPSWTDDTGDPITGTVGTAISTVTVPAVDAGAPAPTYAVHNDSLPAGLTFDTSTREIDGTPTAAGSGTITIRATNSQGTDDWTVAYTFESGTEAPEFADDTGVAVSGVARVAINPITIPRASGSPDPAYTLIGGSPAGLTVTLPTDSADGSITGAPDAAGSGTIRVRAINSEGSDDWTVGYSFAAPVAGNLDFAGFEATGIIHMYMRITAGMYTRGNGQINLWASSLWTADGSAGQVGTLADGSPVVTGIAGNAPTIRRFCKWSRGGSDERFILNSQNGNLGNLFDSSGDPYRISYVVESDSGGDVFTLEPPSTGGGGSYADWRRSASNFSDEQWEALDGIADGEDVLLVLHQGTATYTPAVTQYDIGLAFAGSASGAFSLAVENVEATEVFDVGLSADASAAGAWSLSVEHTEATEVLEVGLSFSGSAASAFALAVEHTETTEVLEIGLAFGANAASSFELALAHLEMVQTYDVGLSWGASAQTDFGLAVSLVEETEVWDVGLAFGGSSATSFALALTHVEAGEVHEVGLSFGGSAVTSFVLAVTQVEASEVFEVGLSFAGGVVGAWSVGLTVTAPPVFADDTGDALSGVTRVAINAITIPRATGNPTPAYALEGDAPAGVVVSLPTADADGRISGVPDSSGAGTITVRATNAAGSDDWMVDYDFVRSVAGDLNFDLFQATGTIHMYMRIVAGAYTRGNGQVNLWASDQWTSDGSAGQVGSLADGSARITGVDGNSPVLRRFAKFDGSGSDDRFILNSTGVDNIGALFDQTGDVHRISFVREVESGGELTTLEPPSRGEGTAFVDWRRTEANFTDEMWNSLNAIADGDEVLLIVHQGTAEYLLQGAEVGLSFDASAASAWSLAVQHVEATEVLALGLQFSATAAGAFSLSVEHVEVTEVLELGLSFGANAAAVFGLALDHVEVTETYDIGLSWGGSAQAAFALGLEHAEATEVRDIGLAFGGAAASAFSLAVDHVEATEIHTVGLTFGGSAQSAFALAISHIEGTEVYTVGLSFGSPAAATFGLALAHVEATEIYDIGLSWGASAQTAFSLAVEHTESREVTVYECDLGVPETVTSTRIRYGFETPITGCQIPAGLLEGDGPAFLKVFSFDSDGGSSFIYTADNDGASEFGSAAGPDLNSVWEGYSEAITLVASHGEVILPGPGLWGTSGDTSETYQAVLRTADATRLATWLSGYVTGSSVTAILRDGIGFTTFRLGLAFGGSATSDFSLAVSHVETGEVLDIGLAFSASASGELHPFSLFETVDVGIEFPGNTAAGAWSLGIRKTPPRLLGLSFVADAASAFSLAVGHTEATDIHAVGLVFGASSQAAFGLAIDHVEETEVYTVGLSFAGDAVGAFSLSVEVRQRDPLKEIGLAFGGSVAGVWSLELRRVGAPPPPPAIVTEARAAARSLVGHEDKYALEITHSSLSTPIRLVNEKIDYVIGGNTFKAFGFSAEPPQSQEGQLRRASVRVDNVGRDLMSLIEGSRGAFGASMKLMQVVPDVQRGIVGGSVRAEIAWEVVMSVGITEANNESVVFTLIDEPIVGRRSVSMRHDPVTSPGLF